MSSAGNSGYFLSFEEFSSALREVLSEIKEAGSATEGSGPSAQMIGRLKEVIEKGMASGRILDGFQERTDMQGELDYAAKLYCRYAGIEPMEPALATYDPAALKQIRAELPDFVALGAQDWVPEKHRPSAAVVTAYLESLTRTHHLRFEDGLVAELASQLANDPDAWAILAFTLKRLTRDMRGNKIRRPERHPTIDCRGLLVEHAAVLYNAVLETGTEAEKDTFRAIMARLGVAAQVSASHDASEASLLKVGGKDEGPRILEMLLTECVAVKGRVEGQVRWSLAHRSLPARWSVLGQWVDAQREKNRWFAIKAVAAAASLSAVILGTLVLLQIRHAEIRAANGRSGDSLVKLMKGVTGDSPSQLEERRRDALAGVVEAYQSKPTPITYGALFQVVNKVAAQREGDAGYTAKKTVSRFAITLSADQRRIDGISDGRRTVVPAPQRGNPIEVYFSPNQRYFAVVYDSPSKKSYEIYGWPEGVAIRSAAFQCGEAYTPRSLRISASGRFFGYECSESGPESMVGTLLADALKNQPAETPLDRIMKVAKNDLLVFFDSSGLEDRYVITGHPSGALRKYDLTTLKREVEFVLPVLSAVTPRDVAIVHTGRTRFQAAVLDRQGVVTLYSTRRPIVDLLLGFGLPYSASGYVPSIVLFPRAESPAQAHINTVLQTDNVRWDAILAWFNGAGTCLSVRYTGEPQEPPRADGHGRVTIHQYFRDEMFLVATDKLLTVADHMMRGGNKVSRDVSCANGQGSAGEASGRY